MVAPLFGGPRDSARSPVADPAAAPEPAQDPERPDPAPSDGARPDTGTTPASAQPDLTQPATAGPGWNALRTVRRFGTTGALLMAVGALGAGALPVPNPLGGLRVLGLPARNVTLAIAVTYAGMAMVVLAWLWLGRLLRHPTPDRPAPTNRQIIRTIALWAAPLAIAPPLFSRDVYSYLAQSAIAVLGLDPFELGPADALGIDHPLTSGVPTIWRDTGAPYGPLFLVLGGVITRLTGDDVLLGVIAHRVLALAGFAMIIWALQRLARRVGADPTAALWLGAANPLVLFHLVSGTHNEAIMLGLMLVGLELALANRWLLGAVVITLAATIKVPALVALGFVGMHMARGWGGRVRDVVRAYLLLGLVAAGLLTAVSLGSGLGFGWTQTLGVPSIIQSWMSVSTDLGRFAGGIGILAGLGDHTDTALLFTRGAGLLAGAVICCLLLAATLRGRMDPVTGTGLGLGALVLLGPVVHPWYLLWAAVPLAASSATPRYRNAAVAVSAVLALVVPPTGADFAFRAFQLPMAIVAGGVILLAALFLVRRRVPL
jgi:alpha-1,6-mannosyltransferase